MNSEEGVSLAKMAVTVLLVVLVIGAVIAVVYAAYSWFSSGTDRLGDQVTSISKTSFSNYDDVKVSGTNVLTALKEYRDSEIAVFISTLKNQGEAGAFDLDTTQPVTCYNYCAVAECMTAAANNRYSGTIQRATASNEEENALAGLFVAKDGLKYDPASQNVIRNTNFSPTTLASEKDCYVKQSAEWYANLVYDDVTGDVCGILFRQMN